MSKREGTGARKEAKMDMEEAKECPMSKIGDAEAGKEEKLDMEGTKESYMSKVNRLQILR